jgi:hypothetical protein
MSQPTGFYPCDTRGRPSDQNQRLRSAGCGWAGFGPGGRTARAGIPAQAQVAAWARGGGGLLGRAPLAERAGPLESARHLLDRAGVAMGHVRELGLRAELIKEMNFILFLFFFRSNFYMNSMNI